MFWTFIRAPIFILTFGITTALAASQCEQVFNSPSSIQISAKAVGQLTALPIAHDTEFIKIATLLESSQFPIFSQKGVLQNRLSSTLESLKMLKYLDEIIDLFKKDFTGEVARNPERIEKLESLQKNVLSNKNLSSDPKEFQDMMNEFRRAVAELSLRRRIPDTLADLKVFEKDHQQMKSEIADEVKYLDEMNSFHVENKISEPSQLYVWNYYVNYQATLKKIKSRKGADTANLTDAEIFAIYYYTTPAYKTINSALRKRQNDTQVQGIVELISSALGKMRPYQGLVKRVEEMNPKMLAQRKIGAIYKAPAFTSTSVASAKGAFQNEKNQVLMIKSRNGRYISPFSDAPSEQEVLFLPNSRFKVLDRNQNVLTVEEIGFFPKPLASE